MSDSDDYDDDEYVECTECEGVYIIESICEDGRCNHCNDGGVDTAFQKK
jgi:hypothetical protein